MEDRVWSVLIMQARLTLIKLSIFLQILQGSGTVTKALPTMQSQAWLGAVLPVTCQYHHSFHYTVSKPPYSDTTNNQTLTHESAMNGVLSDVITSCSSTLGKIFSLLGSCKTCPSDNVAISALVAEGYHWKFEWVAPSMTDSSKFWYFFAVDTPSYTLDLWYLYEWNVQVLTNVTVWVVFLYIVWFLSYSCFSSIYICGPSSRKHTATMQFQKCMNQEQLYYFCISCIPFNRQIWFVVYL